MTPLPLLRAPPFPWVTPHIAAIGGGGAIGPGSDEPPPAGLLEAVREARVGGSFWAPPAGVTDDLVVRAASAVEARALLSAAGATGSGVLVGPAGCGAWDVPARKIVENEVDPWSLLAPGVRLAAPPGDEWRTIAHLVGAEIIGGAHPADDAALAAIGAGPFRDPFTGAASDIARTIALLRLWRETLDANRAIAACAGIAWWKRERIGQFLWTGRRYPLVFVDADDEAIAAAQAGNGALAVWPSRVTPELLTKAAAAGVPIVRIEDGFIRSIGLGADLLPPFSIVADTRGLYYDPGEPSDLEHLLMTTDFPPALQARATRLGETMVVRGVSKYGSAAPVAPITPRRRRTVLVAGQVEDDLSVKTAGGDVAGNLDLLRRARAAEPDAILIFKPHPDVDAGHRVGRVADAALLAFADEVVRDEPIPSLLARVDAVHVLTSLVGFEALLRGLETHVHGRPFYVGWGLTDDCAGAPARRTRRRALAELTAATLILYPRYIDPVTLLPCPPEILLDRFAAGWKPKPGPIVRLRRLQGKLFKLFGRATS